LIEERPVQVLRMLPEAIEAARECLHLVLEHLRLTAGYRVSNGHVVRPDGARVMISEDEPLRTLGRLIQEDICILQPGPAGHRLTGAVLCFPASWNLAEKIGHPLIRIHAPVGEYDDRIAQSVQRIFDTLRPERPVWRANALLYAEPELYSPRRETEPTRDITENGGYLRSEKQVLRRLPRTHALVFSIHTSVVPVERLRAEERASLDLVRQRGRETSDERL
ncbi:MAG: DUF3445 domain-containing protein, partial [Pseudomonadota bacterium]